MNSPAADERVETLVIGAGISGLAFAHALGPNADVLVLDAAEHVGGWLHTTAVAQEPGARYEVGAEAVQDQHGDVAELCAAVGVQTLRASLSASRRYLVKDKALVALPASFAGFITTRLLSASGKLRALSECVRDSKLALDGSVADFARHRFGREVLEAFVDPFLSGVHAGDPEQVSLRAAFPALATMVEQHGSVTRGLLSRKGRAGFMFKPAGGMQRLPEGLARALGSRIRLRTPVRELQRTPDGFRATTELGTIHARRTLVATERCAAANLLAQVAPSAARELGAMSAESLVAVVHGWKREQVGHALDGFGFLAPSREHMATLGTLFSSTIDPGCAPEGQVVLRSLLGGARRKELVEESDERLIGRAIEENSKLLGLSGSPRWTRVLRYRGAIPRYDLDHPRRIAAIEAELKTIPGLMLLCNAVQGPGVSALIARARQQAGR